MSSDSKRHTIRLWGLSAVAALATILVAATVEPEANWLRLRAIPREERQRLVENLQKIDLLFTEDQKRSLRDLDRQINELDPPRRAQYLSALHRYHNWLGQLPELKQGELKEKPAGERMALIKKLVADHPVPRALTTRFLQFADVGDYSPFELAAIYEVWQELKPAERQRLENMKSAARRQALLRKGEERKIADQVNPSDHGEEKWARDFETWVRKNRPALLTVLGQEGGRADILHRQAINHHFLELKSKIKPVAPEHLVELLSVFPPWLRSSFDHYPPDEARRRLTVVYRLVFPAGSEIKLGSTPPTKSAVGAASKSVPAHAPARPGGKAPAAKGASPF